MTGILYTFTEDRKEIRCLCNKGIFGECMKMRKP